MKAHLEELRDQAAECAILSGEGARRKSLFSKRTMPKTAGPPK